MSTPLQGALPDGLTEPPETDPLKLATWLLAARGRIPPHEDATMIAFYRSEVTLLVKALERMAGIPQEATGKPLSAPVVDYSGVAFTRGSGKGQASPEPSYGLGYEKVNDFNEEENVIRHTISETPVDQHGQVFAPRDTTTATSGVFIRKVPRMVTDEVTLGVEPMEPEENWAGIKRGTAAGYGGLQQGQNGNYAQQVNQNYLNCTGPEVAQEEAAIRQAALRGGYPPEKPAPPQGYKGSVFWVEHGPNRGHAYRWDGFGWNRAPAEDFKHPAPPSPASGSAKPSCSPVSGIADGTAGQDASSGSSGTVAPGRTHRTA